MKHLLYHHTRAVAEGLALIAAMWAARHDVAQSTAVFTAACVWCARRWNDA